MLTPKKKGWNVYINIRKVDFRTKNIARDKKEHYINGKESVHQDYITILNVYVKPHNSDGDLNTLSFN